MNQFTTKGVLHVLMWNYKKFNNVQKTQKNQNTDPAFNSYLLLNGLKKNEKKKDLLLRVDTHWNIKMLRIHQFTPFKICKNVQELSNIIQTGKNGRFSVVVSFSD